MLPFQRRFLPFPDPGIKEIYFHPPRSELFQMEPFQGLSPSLQGWQHDRSQQNSSAGAKTPARLALCGGPSVDTLLPHLALLLHAAGCCWSGLSLRLHLAGVVLGESGAGDHGVWIPRERVSVGICIWRQVPAALVPPDLQEKPQLWRASTTPGKSFSQCILL